jgi:hypothetical protein
MNLDAGVEQRSREDAKAENIGGSGQSFSREKARHIRFNCNGSNESTLSDDTEIQVYGRQPQ